MSAEYRKAHETYRKLAEASAKGDAQAKADKAKVAQEIRSMERAGAREGKLLAAEYKGGSVNVVTTDAPSKRSLQEEYVRKFDGEKTVKIDGKETTLRQYHAKRLLGRNG